MLLYRNFCSLTLPTRLCHVVTVVQVLANLQITFDNQHDLKLDYLRLVVHSL